MESVSFIVPAFNEEKFLAACLDSIARQKGPFELVVVDNNSTDRTSEIASVSADHVVSCASQGIAAARNCGAKVAKGDILAFVDSDAVLSENWLSRGFSSLQSSGLDAVSGWNFFTESHPMRFCWYNSYSAAFWLWFRARLACGKAMVVGNNMLIRRRAFEETGGFPRYVGEDMKLSAALTGNGSRTGFCGGMRIAYQARRFRRTGFIRTMRLWISSLTLDIPEQGYAIDYNQAP
jgi:glycosyltransferase involved in cell wall biosynthesis